jgi:signal transduction histidine kinase
MSEELDLLRGELEAAEQNRVLTEIQNLAVRLASLPADAELPDILAEELRNATTAAAVTFGEYRANDRSIILKSIRTESGALEKFGRATGIRPAEIVSHVDERSFAEMLGAGVAYRDSLSEVTFGQVPEIISAAVGKIFGIGKYIGISYVYEGQVYGTSVLIFRSGARLPREDFLTAFSALGALALRRRVADGEVRRLNEGLETMVEERTRQLKESNSELERSNAELERTLGELKATQSRLILSEKMATLGQLMAGIAHELNTPMGAILSSARKSLEGVEASFLPTLRWYRGLDESLCSLFDELYEAGGRSRVVGMEISTREARAERRRVAGLLEASGVEGGEALAEALLELGVLGDFEEIAPRLASAEARELVRQARGLSAIGRSIAVIEASALKAAKVIEALRLYARNDSSQAPSLVDVGASIETVLTLYYNKTKHGVEVQRSIAPGSRVMGRAEELERVWVNLINNALQAMEYKGALEIRTEVHGRQLLVSVADDGPGIGPEIQARIFEPFFTTKGAGEGTGLGLDIARKIVENHKGSITFESRPGRTVFSVRLPLAGEKSR